MELVVWTHHQKVADAAAQTSYDFAYPVLAPSGFSDSTDLKDPECSWMCSAKEMPQHRHHTCS